MIGLDLAPATYLNVAVPPEIAEQWDRWEGADWRRMRHMDANNMFPPDMRFGVRSPKGMCPVHLEIRRGYRDMHFDPVSGNRWPGHPGSFLDPIEADLDRVREHRRCEWDRKASEQMKLTEEICLSGRSPQCADSLPGTEVSHDGAA